MYNTVFKKLLDIGDIIGVKGNVFSTQMGEITVNVQEFKCSVNPEASPRRERKRGPDFRCFYRP